jgi:D-alanyl-D-alanine carboxypeptidase/D-alanyl-D-alanine-endopeptidase (penicillin-binding protein 4)
VLAAPASAQPSLAPADGGVTPVAREGSELARKDGISRRELQRRLRGALRSAGGHSGAWVVDTEAPRKPKLYASNGRDRLIPASNQKLFTTAAALDRFGANGRLQTLVHRRGDVSPNGRLLDGDLILVGDGDPALATHGFADRRNLPLTPVSDLASDIRRSGIRRIGGDVRADASVFDTRRGVAATGWSAGPYLSPLSGLSFNSGFDGGGYASSPPLEAAKALKRSLRRHGVGVTGRVGRSEAPDSILAQDPLASVGSPPLKKLAAATNKPSNNFFAEMLLKRLAAEGDRKGTTRRGASKVERFARRVASGDQAVDGSGLGRGNRATPRQVARLLTAVQRGPGGGAFRSSLPLAGREGTLANRMRGTAAEGRCRAKTGTLSGVSALSGYCRAGHGTVAFAILNNDVDVNAARRAQDAMAAAIARYRP